MNIEQTKADISRNYPIEDMLETFMDKIVWKSSTIEQTVTRLQMARFLVDKAKRILIEEMPYRGSEAVLEAISKVEKIEESIDEMLGPQLQ